MKTSILVNNPITKSMRIGSFFCTHTGVDCHKVYFVQNKKGEMIGKFCLGNDGLISNLKFKNRFRRTKEGICALFAIKKFAEKSAIKDKLNFLRFDADSQNPNNVVSLYKKFSTQVNILPSYFILPYKKGRKLSVEDLLSSYHFILPLNTKGRKYLANLQRPISITLNQAKKIIGVN